MNIWKAILTALGLFPKQIKEYAKEALRITTNIKAAIDSPIAIAITDLIPGDTDNAIRERWSKALEYAVDALMISERCNTGTSEEQALCWIKELSVYKPSVRAMMLQKCQSLMTAHLDGGEQEQKTYDTVSQLVYLKESKSN